MIKHVRNFHDKKIKNICFKVLNNNSYFAHGENILIGMFGDSDQVARNMAVDNNKILSIQTGEEPEDPSSNEADEEIDELELSEESESESSDGTLLDTESVRKFVKPKRNFQCTSYTSMTKLVSWETQPPLLSKLSNDEIEAFRITKFKTLHTCHSQNIERRTPHTFCDRSISSCVWV